MSSRRKYPGSQSGAPSGGSIQPPSSNGNQGYTQLEDIGTQNGFISNYADPSGLVNGVERMSIPAANPALANTSTPQASVPRRGGNLPAIMPENEGPEAHSQAPYIPEQANLSCPPEFLRLTLGVVPHNQELLNACQIPMGAIIQPLSETSEHPPPLVEYLKAGIVRCNRCRAYVNPFVKFLEGGRCWRCNLCNLLNKVPDDYFAALGPNGMRVDIGYNAEGQAIRPELMSCVVEFQPTADYMVRPPQPATYMLLIDVSYYSVSTGILQIAANTLMQLISQLPGGNHTQIGLITFDSKIHFYDLSGSRPHVQVSGSLQELFVPSGFKFLVHRHDYQEQLSNLLGNLAQMYADTKEVQTCLGAAMQAAKSILAPVGGKLMIFTGLFPIAHKTESLGPGRLQPRFEAKLLGTPKEDQLLKPQLRWYTDFALDCSQYQISIDMFLFDNKSYIDVATLSQASQLTGGQCYFYHDWNAYRDGEKLCRDLERNLLRTTAFEASMRVRCSHGVRVINHLGNVFLRSSDLMALPNVDADKAFGVQLSISESLLNVPYFFMQSALLYTTSERERRIRVITAAIPTTSSLADVYKYADVEAVACLIGKLAIEKEQRTLPTTKLIEIARAYTKIGGAGLGRQAPSSFPLPDSLQALPLFVLSMMKNTAYRQASDIHPDQRSATLNLLRILPTDLFIQFIYPAMYRVYPMEPDHGTLDEAGAVILPPILNLSAEKIDRKAIFVMDNGQDILVWFGRDVSPDIYHALFGVQHLSPDDINSVRLKFRMVGIPLHF